MCYVLHRGPRCGLYLDVFVPRDIQGITCTSTFISIFTYMYT